MLPIEPWNEIYFPCFYFISSGCAVKRIEFFFCLLRNESFLVIFFYAFLCFSLHRCFFFFFQAIFSRERKWIISMSTKLRIKKLRSNIWIINYPKKQLVEVITLFLTFFRLLKTNHFLIIFELSCFSLYPCFLQAIFSVESGLLVYRRTKFGD